MEPFLGPALDRIPVLSETGVRTFFCGPESFTADVRPLLGPAPELDGYFVAAGLNSLGILSGGGVGSMLAHWIVDGVPPVDATSVAIDRTRGVRDVPPVPGRADRGAAGRAVRGRGLAGLEAVDRAERAPVGAARPAGRGGRALRRLGGLGVRRVVRARDGGPGAAPGLRAGRGRTQIVGREHAAVREAVGLLDMSLMAKLLVQGPGAAAVLSRLSANDVTAGLGRLVYTQWLNEAGGIVADVTVTWLEPEKFLVIASDLIHRRIEPLIRRATRPGEFLTVTDVTSGTTLLSVQGPASRELIGRLTDADLSNEAFPYLSARQIHAGYAPVLALRVTYVGELGWELHVPAEYALGVYDDLVAAGDDLGLPAGRPLRHVQPAAGKGLPRHGRGHRQHRQPAGGRARVRGGLGQAGRVHRP